MADEAMAAEEKKNPETAAPTPNDFAIDARSVSTVYTNFCRVMTTPEELILDFGLNPHLVPNPTEKVLLTHRVVMNFFTAKRLLNALANVVSQHESGFGALELDFQRRGRKM